MNKMEMKQTLGESNYEAPRVEVLEVEVEKGFAGSNVTMDDWSGWSDDESMGN